MSAIDVNIHNFEEEVLKSDVPVLVDFWAIWCGPCRMLSPVVEQVAENADGFKVCKVNVDEEEELANRFGINAIPCLIVFKGGKEVKRSVGVIGPAAVEALIKNA